jgi:hypothetical protein
VSVLTDQPFITRARLFTFQPIKARASLGALSSALLIAGSSLSKSKLLPRSIPIRFIWARIGSSVMCGGCNLRISAAYAKNLPDGIVSTWVFGGVFMSMPGSTVPTTGSKASPKREIGVTLKPA